jgi:hypothetical protein
MGASSLGRTVVPSKRANERRLPCGEATPTFLAMPTYRVLVHGDGLVIRRWLFWRRRLGLFVTRYVDATDEAGAAALALEQVRGEPRLALTAVRAPMLRVDEIELVDGLTPAGVAPGIVFYEEQR